MRSVELMADGLIATVKGYVDHVVGGVKKQLADLTAMAAALEQRVQAIPAAEKGPPGTSAYQLACLGGFKGSEAEWLDSLRGERGEKGEAGTPGERGAIGERGEQGPIGPAGERGERGEAGAIGERGLQGEQGPIGPVGEKGEKGDVGPAGASGERGKDGESVHPDTVQLMIVKEVDRSLALWPRPKDGDRGKDGADGFGFDDLSVEYDGRRSFTMKFTQGERTKEFAFKIPAIIDAGIFRRGVDYEQGDAVTWDGSTWFAQRDTSDKPGESDAWRLSAKRGRDGKDLRPEEPQTQQVVRLR